MGGTSDQDGRDKFDFLIRELLTGPLTEETKQKYNIIDEVGPPSKPLTVPIPTTADVYSWRFVIDGLGRLDKI